jgi:hypothetical protein
MTWLTLIMVGTCIVLTVYVTRVAREVTRQRRLDEEFAVAVAQWVLARSATHFADAKVQKVARMYLCRLGREFPIPMSVAEVSRD